MVRRNDNGEIEVEFPFGRITAPGKMLAALVIIGGLSGLGLLADRHEKESAERQRVLLEAVRSTISEVTYVLSLPQNERERLRLDMPDSLRRRSSPQ